VVDVDAPPPAEAAPATAPTHQAEDVDRETGEVRTPAPPDELTSSTPWPHEGKLKGIPVKDWPGAMLKWAIVPGRKLGERTDEWQQVAKEELERRTTAPKPAA